MAPDGVVFSHSKQEKAATLALGLNFCVLAAHFFAAWTWAFVDLLSQAGWIGWLGMLGTWGFIALIAFCFVRNAFEALRGLEIQLSDDAVVRDRRGVIARRSGPLVACCHSGATQPEYRLAVRSESGGLEAVIDEPDETAFQRILAEIRRHARVPVIPGPGMFVWSSGEHEVLLPAISNPKDRGPDSRAKWEFDDNVLILTTDKTAFETNWRRCPTKPAFVVGAVGMAGFMATHFGGGGFLSLISIVASLVVFIAMAWRMHQEWRVQVGLEEAIFGDEAGNRISAQAFLQRTTFDAESGSGHHLLLIIVAEDQIRRVPLLWTYWSQERVLIEGASFLRQRLGAELPEIQRSPGPW